MASIVSEEEVFAQFKGDSLKAYKRCWLEFVEFSEGFDFEARPPGEEELSKYFKFLRFEKKVASSLLWTKYSYINSIMKRMYSVRLQEFPRLTLLIKGFSQDVKQKAAIFDDVQIKNFMLTKTENTYWLVRQSICIVAFFGGLRLQECRDLVLEKVQRGPEGYFVTHSRVKQRRSDKMESKFLVPDAGGYAAQFSLYLFKVNNQLKKFQGRVWYTGTKSEMLKSQPMGRNMVANSPHEIAVRLSLPDPSLYTFHSFRRTSATSAADGGSSTAQMTDFFGWKSPNMCQEYVSSSKPAVTSMAKTLAADVMEVEVVQETQDFNMQEVEVELEVDLAEEAVDPLFVLAEDFEMYAAAGLPIPNISKSIDVGGVIKNVMSSVPDMSGANVTFKIVVNTGNNSTMNF